MLTRRHIRVKVMQSVYALTQSGNPDLEKEEKFLNVSMENMYSLYLNLLALLMEIQKKAESQLHISKKKYLATSEEKNPNKKFVSNLIFKELLNNKKIQKAITDRKLSWELDSSYVDHIYNAVLNSADYAYYMKNEANTFEEDKAFIASIYTNTIAVNDKLYEYIEDHRLTWIDDLPIVNTLLIKILEKSKPGLREDFYLPDLFKDDDDRLFAKELLKKTVLNYEKLQMEIEGKTPNWDTERIADLDAILLKMAICEFLKFPSIPVKVTINEYVEIAKEYSTPKSSVFINGILDKLVKEYQSNNTLNKTGRGLL